MVVGEKATIYWPWAGESERERTERRRGQGLGLPRREQEGRGGSFWGGDQGGETSERTLDRQESNWGVEGRSEGGGSEGGIALGVAVQGSLGSDSHPPPPPSLGVLTALGAPEVKCAAAALRRGHLRGWAASTNTETAKHSTTR